jgi:tripartite-type tricarboxylate transporter receptor subunit TctC
VTDKQGEDTDMTTSFRPTRRAALAGAAAALLGMPAHAQGAWPDRPVRIIAPFAPGGSADTLGRLVAQELQASLGQSFVVENRAGAGGVLGSAQVARAAADGYSYVISGIASHVIAPATNPAVEFHPIRDFTHVAFLGGPPIAFVVATNVPAATLAEFIALARGGRPFAFGSPGAGTHGHLFGVAIQQAAGITMEHVPYRGAGNAMADLMSGALPAGSITLTSAAAGIRSGRLRALGVTSARRVAAFPDIPTFAEQGYPDMVGQTWFGIAGPAGIPAPVATRLNAEVNRIMAAPAIEQRLTGEGIDWQAYDLPAYARFVEAEFERWGTIARAAGLRTG